MHRQPDEPRFADPFAEHRSLYAASDVLRADFGAIAHESTAPYAVLAVQLRHTLLLTVVAAIFVITMRQRNGSRTDELWVQAKLRARGVAQTTVDATGE